MISHHKNNLLEYLSIAAIIFLLLFSAYLVYKLYTTYTANQYNSSSYTPQLAKVIVFGYSLPSFILPPAIQGVNTESETYTAIISNILIIDGALLGFYSLVALEIVKAIKKLYETQKSYKKQNKIIKFRTMVDIILVIFLILSIYAILFVSIIDASHASVYQGIVITSACQIATTIEQGNMALHNITYGEIDCQGIPTPLEVGHSSQQLNISLSTQLQDETMEITRYEGLLFSGIKNAGNTLEIAILLLPILIITYAITLFISDYTMHK